MSTKISTYFNKQKYLREVIDKQIQLKLEILIISINTFLF